MKNILIKQLLEWILPLIKDNILKFEKQLYAQMEEIPLHTGENNVVFMIYAADGSLKGGLGVIETALNQDGIEDTEIRPPHSHTG